MNLVDYIIIGIVGVSVLFGMYRGFVQTVLNAGGCVAAFLLSFKLYPKLALFISSNEKLVNTLMYYLDADKRIGDVEMAVTDVGKMTGNFIGNLINRLQLPDVFSTLLRTNMENQVYQPSGMSTASGYVSQTILSAAINIISFVLCFAALALAVAIIANILKVIFRFPVLKQLDGLAGGAFGLLRGCLICYVLFALVPIVQTVMPLAVVDELIAGSTLSPIFNNGNLILSIMNGGL